MPIQPYFVKILGRMRLAPGQLHPNGWRVLSALFVLWERCELGEPSLMKIKYLYQLRSSPKEAGWYYFMSSSAKRKPIVSCPSSCKNWKNKFFFTGGNWCLAIHSFGDDIHLPTRIVTLGRLFLFTLHVCGRHLFISLTLFMLSDSWGQLSKLNEDLLLKVETALVNASHCQDLLSPVNLLGSGLVNVVAGMDNKIFSAMSRKRARVPVESSNAPSSEEKPFWSFQDSSSYSSPSSTSEERWRQAS